MKISVLLLALSPLLLADVSRAQESVPPSSAETGRALNPAETKFKELLTKATLTGRWASVNEGELGPEQEDRYFIVSAAKVKDDSWIIQARMKYREQEIVVPIPVQVKWAGDTPVIVVDNLSIPGGGTYSARVLFYEKTYAGSWTGTRRGGLLNGIITNQTE